MVCRLIYFLKLVLTTQSMLFLDCIMLTRYAFIFWLKNPAAFRDDFWSLVINIWVTIFSLVVQIVFEVMLGTDSSHFYICTGSAPPALSPGQKLAKKFNFNNFLQTSTLLIHFVILLKIQVYKSKKITPNQTLHPRSTQFWLVSLENDSLSDMTTNFITTICFVMIGVSQIQINHVNLKDLNHYPNYLYEYFYRMIRVPLMYHLLIFVLYIRNPVLRKTVAREVQSWLRDNLGRRGEVFFRPERY